eukprot:4214378-Alexandrium_andersonii.AAC.1
MPENTGLVDCGVALDCVGTHPCARLAQAIEASGEPRQPVVVDGVGRRFQFGGGEEPTPALFAVSLPVRLNKKPSWME